MYRFDWLQARSLKLRRKAWKNALKDEHGQKPDRFSMALNQRDIDAIRAAFEDPSLVGHTSPDAWDQWTEELIAAGDLENAQLTLSIAVGLSSRGGSELPIRLMRLSNLQHRSGNESLAFETLMKVSTSHLRADEKQLYDALRKRYP